MEINRNAPVVAAHETLVTAPLEAVWQLQTRISAWPDWNPDIAQAELDGPLAVGTTFRWETAGLIISSTLGEIVPLRRLAWRGVTGGITAIHVWTFAPDAQGVLVRTEESWEGAALPSNTDSLQRALAAALDRWLAHLKAAAEAGVKLEK